MKTLTTYGLIALLCSVALPSTVLADTDGAVELTPKEVTTRIDLAARQRMLLERMAKSVCFADAGVHVWDNELSLQSAYISFEIAKRAMAEGDEKLGVAGETNRNFRETSRELDLTWVTLSRLYDEFVQTKEISAQNLDNVMELTDRAHEHSNEIVVQMRTNYAKYIGSGGLGSSILLDFYSRQKELTQELSKGVCLTARGVDKERNLEELNKTLRHFQASLDGFRSGLPALGIKPPPTERIARQLDRTNDRWEEIRAYAETVAAGGTLEARQMDDFEFGIDQVLREVDKAVFLMVDYIARGEVEG